MTGAPVGPPDGPLDTQIDALQRRVATLQERAAAGECDAPLLAALLEELAAAQEELRTAATELHLQHVQLAELHDAQLRRAEAEARVAARDEFFVVAAHELRTPITSLRGYAQILRRHFDGDAVVPQERAARAAFHVEQQAIRLNALVTHLLDVSRIDRGEALVLDRQPVNLVALAQRVAESLQVTTDTHRIAVRGAPESVVLHADSARLEQVLTNLIGNALRHTSGGDVHVDVSKEPSGRVRIAVRDHGPGVPPHARDKIFERFYQADLDRSYVRGLGLGLYISRAIVQAHGGCLTVHSAPGGGALFVATFPA